MLVPHFVQARLWQSLRRRGTIETNRKSKPAVYTWSARPAMVAATAFRTLEAPPSDTELLARHLAGEPAALDELFRRYRGLAYRVAHRLLGNEADALDAVQEGFAKALTHLAGFQGRSSFKTWLLRVVSNAALDLGRQRGRRETLSLDAFAGTERERIDPRAEDDPAAGLERADLRALLDRALAT